MILSGICSLTHSQEKKMDAPFIKGTFQLPTPLANYAFKTHMSGVSDLTFSFNLAFTKSLHAGVYVGHEYFSFDDMSIPETTNASMQIAGAGVTIGYTLSPENKFSVDYSFDAGYCAMLVSSETCKTKTEKIIHQKNGYNFKPSVSLEIKSSETLSFGIVFSYQIMLAHFGPDNLCLNSFASGVPLDYVGPSHIFAIGFGFKTILPARH